MAVLKVEKGSCPGQLVELRGERNVMGRHPSCQIVLDNAAVSRTHAQILESHGSYFLEDLRSRNGTYLNGERIPGRTELKDGDEIKVCEVVLRFLLRAPRVDDAATPRAGVPIPEQRTTAAGRRDPSQSDPSHVKLVEGSDDASSVLTSLDMSSSRHPRINVRPEAKLRAVLEIGQNLARALDLNDVLPRILDSLFKIFPQADRGYVVLKGPGNNDYQLKVYKTRREEAYDSARLSMTILKEVTSKSRAVLSKDVEGDPRFKLSESVANMRIRSFMCAPMVGLGGESLGVIQIDTFDGASHFTEDDLEILASVAAQAALAVENSQLHAAALKQRDLERELDFATQVQLGFLPKERPKVRGYEFFDHYEPAQRVGGDFFDYVAMPDGRLAMAIGDVAGKGVPAALLMARIYSDARYALLVNKTPAQAMAHLNNEVSSGGLGHRFITLAFVILNPKNHELCIVNAGHLPPLVRTAAGTTGVVPVTSSGLPLGIQPGTSYNQTTLEFRRGDSLIVFTDGITEAMNPAGELYGTPRLTEFFHQAPSGAQPVVEAIVADVEKFCAGRAQRDDMCLVCLHRAK